MVPGRVSPIQTPFRERDLFTEPRTRCRRYSGSIPVKRYCVPGACGRRPGAGDGRAEAPTCHQGAGLSALGLETWRGRCSHPGRREQAHRSLMCRNEEKGSFLFLGTTFHKQKLPVFYTSHEKPIERQVLLAAAERWLAPGASTAAWGVWAVCLQRLMDIFHAFRYFGSCPGNSSWKREGGKVNIKIK